MDGGAGDIRRNPPGHAGQHLARAALLVSTLSLANGRTTILQGVVHLVIFGVYLFTTVVP
jgi:Ca2+:H+ antiporter